MNHAILFTLMFRTDDHHFSFEIHTNESPSEFERSKRIREKKERKAQHDINQ